MRLKKTWLFNTESCQLILRKETKGKRTELLILIRNLEIKRLKLSPVLNIIRAYWYPQCLSTCLHQKPRLLQHCFKDFWNLLARVVLRLHELRKTVKGTVVGNVLLCYLSVNSFSYFLHDDRQVVFVLDLQFLMVTSALIRSPSFQDFCQSEEDLAPSPFSLGFELLVVIFHEAIVDIVLVRTPASRKTGFLPLFRILYFLFLLLRVVTWGAWLVFGRDSNSFLILSFFIWFRGWSPGKILTIFLIVFDHYDLYYYKSNWVLSSFQDFCRLNCPILLITVEFMCFPTRLSSYWLIFVSLFSNS